MQDNRFDTGVIGRRQFLKTAGALASTSAVVGCLGSDSEPEVQTRIVTVEGEERTVIRTVEAGSDRTYPTEVVRFIVPFSPGGGFDLNSRAMATMWPDYLPEGGETAVENITGAGGLRGGEAIFDAEPDGHTVGIIHADNMNFGFLEGNIDFNPVEYTTFPMVELSTRCTAVGTQTPYETFDDILASDEPVRFAATGPASPFSFIPKVMGDLLDFPVQVITGYGGSSESIAAVIRGEADAMAITPATIKGPITEGEMRPLLMHDEAEEIPDFLTEANPDIPTTADYDVSNINALGVSPKIFVGPPGIPDDIRQIIDDSMYETATSPEFVEFIEDQGRAVTARRGDVAKEFIENSHDLLVEYEEIIFAE